MDYEKRLNRYNEIHNELKEKMQDIIAEGRRPNSQEISEARELIGEMDGLEPSIAGSVALQKGDEQRKAWQIGRPQTLRASIKPPTLSSSL